MSERSAITTVKIILWEREKWLKILNKSLLRWDHQEILTCYLLDDFLCDRKIALTKELYKIHSIFIKECRILKKFSLILQLKSGFPTRKFQQLSVRLNCELQFIFISIYTGTLLCVQFLQIGMHIPMVEEDLKPFKKKKMFQVWKPICWSLWHVEPALSAFCVWLWRMFEILDDVTTSIHL